MSTHNIVSCGEIKKITIFFDLKKASYQELFFFSGKEESSLDI